MGAFWVGTRPGKFVLAFFGKASAERVVGVGPNLGIAGGLFDFGADELVFEIVLVILVLAVGQLAVDQVAQCVVGVFNAVVFFEAVAANNVAAFALPFCRFVGKDVVGVVEGEGFAAAGLAVAGFLNASDFIVDVIEYTASLVGALNQVAGNGVVFETGAADAFVFALSVAAGDFAALFFDQLAEDVASEPVDVPSLGTLFQTAFMIALAVFGLLHQLSGGIVAVGGDFAVPAGFLDQVVGLVVIKTVGFAVFVGEDGQTAGFVVGVGEGMAQRVGAFERQSVHCEFVGGFGTESVDVCGQPVEAVVFEGFVTAVGVVGTDGVARCVVMVAGGMAQRIGNGFEIAVFGVTETGGFAGTVGKADELVEGVVV